MFLINFNKWKCAYVGINNWVKLHEVKVPSSAHSSVSSHTQAASSSHYKQHLYVITFLDRKPRKFESHILRYAVTVPCNVPKSLHTLKRKFLPLSLSLSLSIFICIYILKNFILHIHFYPEYWSQFLSQPAHGTTTYRCDDTRGCIVQFWPPDDEHVCSKRVETWNKLIIKFSASSCLILRLKKIDLNVQPIRLKTTITLYRFINHRANVYFYPNFIWYVVLIIVILSTSLHDHPL